MTQPRRRESAAPEAPAGLDARGEALTNVLPLFLEGIEFELAAALDEVVVAVGAADMPELCRRAKETPGLDFDYLRCVSVVDYVERLEVSYHLFSLSRRHKMVVKVSLDPDEPRVPTVTGVWRGAEWFEREGHDLFGVVFDGHPDLSPLLLYEGFEGHPGLKSFPFHEYTEW